MGRGYKGIRCGKRHMGILGTWVLYVVLVLGERGSVCHVTDVPLLQRPFGSSHPRPRRTVVEAQRDLEPIKITCAPTYCSAQVPERNNAFLPVAEVEL